MDSIRKKLSRVRQTLEKIQPGCTLPRSRNKEEKMSLSKVVYLFRDTTLECLNRSAFALNLSENCKFCIKTARS